MAHLNWKLHLQYFDSKYIAWHFENAFSTTQYIVPQLYFTSSKHLFRQRNSQQFLSLSPIDWPLSNVGSWLEVCCECAPPTFHLYHSKDVSMKYWQEICETWTPCLCFDVKFLMICLLIHSNVPKHISQSLVMLMRQGCVLMNDEGMNSIKLLEWFLLFSFVFQPSYLVRSLRHTMLWNPPTPYHYKVPMFKINKYTAWPICTQII